MRVPLGGELGVEALQLGLEVGAARAAEVAPRRRVDARGGGRGGGRVPRFGPVRAVVAADDGVGALAHGRRPADGRERIERREGLRARDEAEVARPLELREMRLEPPPGARYSLDDVQWDLESLRLLVGQMLERCQMGVGHLMAALEHLADE